MSQNGNFTKNEHYIPRFYLRFFSPNEKQIYQYKIGSHETSKPVSINSICNEEHLYELRNESSEFICRNAIENTLNNYEWRICNGNQINNIKGKTRKQL